MGAPTAHVLYNKYYEKFTDFREAVLGFLQNLFHASAEMKKALEQRITDSERVNARLKDDFGSRMVRVQGGAKVMCYLMFGILLKFRLLKNSYCADIMST